MIDPSSLQVLVIGKGIPQNREDFSRLANSAAPTSVLPLGYRCVADRLYLPLEAELSPSVTEPELRQLLPSQVSHILVWHPAAGLMEFEPDQIPSAADLLRCPAVTETRFNGAGLGNMLNDRIRSLHPEVSDNPFDIIQQGQDDIGQAAGNIDNAPRSPDEVRNPRLNDAIRGAKQWLATRVFRITDRIPSKPGGNRMLGKLHDWAASVAGGLATAASGAGRGFQRAAHNLSSQRENELKRLLNLLDKDPELGLRYALPFGGRAGRGAATPSGRLGERTPDFNIGEINRSGPADAWDVPWDYQVKLTQRYRDLAQREIRLGNHRRAAYIYATLLHDLNSAATALEAGGLYRDAATIFEKHLKNWQRAASCLRNGGFWEEALVHYQEHSRWIDAGELLLKMDQPQEARIMFRNEICSCESRREFLKAGEVADERLNDAEHAARLLTQGWELNSQAGHCFRKLMELRGRRGQHAQARDVLEAFAGGPNVAVHQQADALQICSETAVGYPDETVKEVARRQSFRLASAMLSGAFHEQQASALLALCALSKSDELLQSDASRFAAQSRRLQHRESKQTRAKQRVTGPRANANTPAIRHLGSVQLNLPKLKETIKWQSAVVSAGFCYCLANVNDASIAVGQFSLPRDFVTARVDGEMTVLKSSSDITFERCQLRAKNVASTQVFLQQFPSVSKWNRQAMDLLSDSSGFLDILQPQCHLILDFVQLPTGTTWALFFDTEGQLVLEAIGLNGLVRQTISLEINSARPANINDLQYRIHHDGTRVFVLSGNQLWRIAPVDLAHADKYTRLTVKPDLVIEFPDTPKSIIASPINTTPRLAFSFSEGAQTVWPLSNESCAFARDMAEPLLTCIGNGLFVAACRSTGRLACYRLKSGSADLVAALDHRVTTDAVIGLLPRLAPNEFLLLHESGFVEKLQIPVR